MNSITSQTKRLVIDRHRSNRLLQTPLLAPNQQTPHDLSVDHPANSPDRQMVDTAMTALMEGETHYADVPGIMPLREKVTAFLETLGLPGYQAARILVTAGIQESRFLTIQMIGDLSGGLGLPAVVHPGVRKAASVRRLDLIDVPVDHATGMLPTLASLHQVLESGCKLLYLESPARLTGAMYDVAAVKEIANLIEQFDAAVIWDQGLAPWVRSGQYASLAAQAGMADRVAIIGEAWPGMGLESWHIGYIGARDDWFEPMRSQKQIMSICTSTPSQYAALKAADLYPDQHNAQFEVLSQFQYEARHHLAQQGNVSLLNGTAVNLVAFETPEVDEVVHSLRQAGFILADGADFGAPGLLRLSVTLDNTLGAAILRLA